MNWTFWGFVLALSVAGGASGAHFYSHRAGLLRAAVPYWLRLRQRLQRRPWLARRQKTVPVPALARRTADEAVVLIPDGRPWPLDAAVQLLELAWRWQVMHGANLPLRARQGEGAYVWRPPLPSGNTPGQRNAEAEH